ncbi:6-bladed beta-propeller [Bacteroides nordii]|uniref:6-bladed beta-propeller n=1 Tax=Bacteroides nordii TaxID=291645 RepID=UPI0025599079|nr:6-bladed beta-propeller [Bacteroides nordii]
MFTFKEAGGVLEDTVFFKSKKIIPLETNELALIGQIDRICMAEDTLFVLDQQSNSVIVYDKDGKYINRIRNVGKGPKEYINIGDICVDNLNKELVVLCAHPSKVQFYSYQGKFLREESLGERYYSHLGTDGRYIYFHDNTNVNKKKEVAVYDRQLNHKADVLEHGKVFENNELGTVTLFGHGNSMTQDSSIHIVRGFDNTIYEAKYGKVYPKYKLDFKEYTLPESLLESKMKPFEFLDLCREKHYVVSSEKVIENSRLVLFTTNIGLFVCDKQSGEMTRHLFLLDSIVDVGSSNIQVIGNTNKIVVVWPVARLKNMMDVSLEHSFKNKLKMEFINKLNAMDDENNPILFIYEL